MAPYIAGQVIAALGAAFLLQAGLGDVARIGATAPSSELMALSATPTAALIKVVVLEIVITFFLMFVITAVATDSRAEGQMAGLAIGFTVALCALFAGPLTGASMNPARSLGPALVAGYFDHLWIYIAAPMIGASLGALSYQKICCRPAEQSGPDACC